MNDSADLVGYDSHGEPRIAIRVGRHDLTSSEEVGALQRFILQWMRDKGYSRPTRKR